MAKRTESRKLLFEGAEWSFDALDRVHDAIERIAHGELGLDTYRNQIEIISAEQMLDAYSSVGMPLMYPHWSFGKHFIQHERLYRKGAQGLAYEIVINSNPCISYCLEENTIALQALVISHAAFGHNHFFKNNHLFRQWTDPDGILDYMEYARTHVLKCEEKYGQKEVEHLLDAAHALMSVGAFRRRRPPELSLRAERERERERHLEEQRAVHYLWDSPALKRPSLKANDEAVRERKRSMRLPEENVLYFIERYSPKLEPWQRDILRIVRNIAQYFYPQQQTKLMNEGCASFVHFHIMNRLHETGRIDDGAMLEILHNRTNVLNQPDFDDPRFAGINPYALGFAMMQDIRRICEDPSEEDRGWFPSYAGSGDWRAVLKDAWANYRDESFIQQFLSPQVIRRFKMFALTDQAEEPYYTVAGIHDEAGYVDVRDALARSYDLSLTQPDIQVSDVDLVGDRVLRLRRTEHDGISLEERDREATLSHIERLWGHSVVLEDA